MIRRSGIPLPQSDEPLSTWIARIARLARLAYRRARRRRARSCLRCGDAGLAGQCVACAALFCGRCSLVSIETGEPARLCVDCARRVTPRAEPPLRRDAAAAFRRGAWLVITLLSAVAALAWRSEGWHGIGRFAAILTHPAVLLGLVPLAWLLGVVATAARQAVARSLGGR